jgi:hypothetical protein
MAPSNCPHPSWAPLPRQKFNTPSLSVNSFRVKDQQKHLAIANVEVTSLGGKGKYKLVDEGINITPMPKVLEKVMIKKDVKKELKLPNNATMDEDLHAADNESNEDSNQKDVDQEETEEYHNLNFEPVINKSLQEDAKDGIVIIKHLVG